MAVLVLTRRLDPTADLVIAELHRREVPVVRCDPGDFPESTALEAEISSSGRVTGVLRQEGRRINLSDIVSVYHRRPSAHRLHPELKGIERRWAEREARSGFVGVLTSLGRPWVNHPHLSAAAAHKPYQLAAAAQVGLTVPQSLVTNIQGAARAFARSGKQTVYKALTGGPGTDERGKGPGALFTTVVGEDDITPGVARTAHLFQEWVDKAFEVRLTVVGELLFAARIDATGTAASTDWRSDYSNLSYSPLETPPQVGGAVMRLMRDLRLVYGALDFVVTPEGRWVFLELNPDGQWGWIQLATGLPIASALAELLERADT